MKKTQILLVLLAIFYSKIAGAQTSYFIKNITVSSKTDYYSIVLDTIVNVNGTECFPVFVSKCQMERYSIKKTFKDLHRIGGHAADDALMQISMHASTSFADMQFLNVSFVFYIKEQELGHQRKWSKFWNLHENNSFYCVGLEKEDGAIMIPIWLPVHVVKM